MGDEQRYLAYLVRLWTVRRSDDVVWRASTANAHTGEQHFFADLASLFAFFFDHSGGWIIFIGSIGVDWR